MRAILSGAFVRPAWQFGAFRVEGLDEDAFTLGVAAVGQLGDAVRASGTTQLRRLHVVGSFPAMASWGFSEALGIPGLEVRRHAGGPAGFWGALAAAAQDPGPPGREAVVAAEGAGPPTDGTVGRSLRWGAGAAALLLGEERGLAVIRHRSGGRASHREPDMKAEILDWLRPADLPTVAARGEALILADEDPGKWLVALRETAPRVAVSAANLEPGAARVARFLRSALLLRELVGRLRTGATGLVVEADGGWRGFGVFQLDGPVRWVGDWTEPGPGIPRGDERFLDRNRTEDGVSQGAYVPHPRYLENLPSRWRLVADFCSGCRKVTFPQRGYCRHCGGATDLRTVSLPRDGLQIEALTTIGPGAQPTEFDPQVDASGPYEVAMVRLGPDVFGTLQVTDCRPGSLRVGDRVGTALRRLYAMEGEWRYGLKAVPRPTQGPDSS